MNQNKDFSKKQNLQQQGQQQKLQQQKSSKKQLTEANQSRIDKLFASKALYLLLEPSKLSCHTAPSYIMIHSIKDRAKIVRISKNHYIIEVYRHGISSDGQILEKIKPILKPVNFFYVLLFIQLIQEPINKIEVCTGLIDTNFYDTEPDAVCLYKIYPSDKFQGCSRSIYDQKNTSVNRKEFQTLMPKKIMK